MFFNKSFFVSDISIFENPKEFLLSLIELDILLLFIFSSTLISFVSKLLFSSLLVAFPLFLLIYSDLKISLLLPNKLFLLFSSFSLLLILSLFDSLLFSFSQSNKRSSNLSSLYVELFLFLSFVFFSISSFISLVLTLSNFFKLGKAFIKCALYSSFLETGFSSNHKDFKLAQVLR